MRRLFQRAKAKVGGIDDEGTVAKPAPTVPTSGQASVPDASRLADDRESHSLMSMEVHSAQKDSLWSQAFEKLRTEDPILVEKYEELLAREHQPMRDGVKDHAARQRLGQQELAAIADRGLQRLEDKKTKYTIFGQEYALKDQFATGTKFVLQLKDFISEAVKASPEASLAWAGVCAVLPLLTNPSAADEATTMGFDYTTSRMQYYTGLEKLLWRSKTNLASGLRMELKGSIVKLYKQILEFQVKCVLRFYRQWLLELARDVVNLEDWNGMLEGIKASEVAIRSDFKQVNDSSSLGALELLTEQADQATASLAATLSIAEKQLHVAQESRDHLKGIAMNMHDMSRRFTAINDDQAVLDLPAVYAARCDAADVGNKRLGCLKGTRTRFLRQIQNWVDDHDAPSMLWLSGPAGTGKSTLTYTVTRSLRHQNKLAGGYFFRRGQLERNKTAKVFSTIASQMADFIPEFKQILKHSLRGLSSTAIESKALEEQFGLLISTPLEKLQETATSHTDTFVIILDALDECEEEGNLSIILELLLQLAILTSRVCVLVTSRKTAGETFGDPSLENDSLNIQIHKEHPDETRKDIELFLKDEFAKAKAREKVDTGPWPSADEMQLMIAQSTTPSPLFIYASTLSKFINETKRKTPRKQLENWIKLHSSGHSLPQLAQVYLPALHDSFGLGIQDNHADVTWDDDMRAKLRLLIFIVHAATPLSSAALAGLLNENQNVIIDWLQDLQAFLDIPGDLSGPVRVLHKSFADFMTDKSESRTLGPFYLKSTEAHLLLGEACIERMSSDGLKKNICHVQDPSTEASNSPPGLISDRIPSDLNYACIFWTHHFSSSGQPAEIGKIFKFLCTHLLHWLEALSWLRKTQQALEYIAALRFWLKTPQIDISESNLSLLDDTNTFVRAFASMIDSAPLQAYGGALVFCPPSNKVKQMFWMQRLSFIRDCRGVEQALPSNQTVFEVGESGTAVNGLTYSPCGKFIAVLANGPGICIEVRAADSGALIRKVSSISSGDKSFNMNPYSTVAFSFNGSLLAASLGRGGAHIWDFPSGAHKQTIPDNTTEKIQVGADQNIRESTSSPVCELASVGERLWSLVAKEFCFAPDGVHAAVGLQGGSITIWNIEANTLYRSLPADTEERRVRPICFSPDSRLLVGEELELTGWVNRDPKLYVWEVASGKVVLRLSSEALYGEFEKSASALGIYGEGKCNNSADESFGRIRLLDVLIVFFSSDSKSLRLVASSRSEEWTIFQSCDIKTGLIQDSTIIDGVHYAKLAVLSHNPEAFFIMTSGTAESGGYGGNLCHICDAKTGTKICDSVSRFYSFMRVALSPSLQNIAIGEVSAVHLVELSHASLADASGRSGSVTDLFLLPGKQKVLCAALDSTIRCLDIATAETTSVFYGYLSGAVGVCLAADGESILAVFGDGTIQSHDRAAGTHDLVWPGPGKGKEKIALSPKGDAFAILYSERVEIWEENISEARSYSLQNTLNKPNHSICDVSFSSEGTALATLGMETVLGGGDTNSIILWDVASGKEREILSWKVEDHGRFSSYCPYLEKDTDRLKTSIGEFTFATLTSKAVDEIMEPALSYESDGWIRRRGKRVIRTLSGERYQPYKATEDVFMLGCSSGEVVFIYFHDEDAVSLEE